MRNIIQNQPFLLLKFLIFSILMLISLEAEAEYYLVYSAPEYYDMCFNCHTSPSHKHHSIKSKKSQQVHHHYRSYARGGLYVYYPLPCFCCSHPNHIRSQWGDYVVFTSRPADRRYGIPEDEKPRYNPDLSTADDGGADLEIN